MWNQAFRKSDPEAGLRPLYPMMLESPELRWSFIRKIYAIVAIQLVATIAVGAVVVSVRPVANFFVSTGAGLALYIVLIITPFIVLCPLYYYHQKHPVNYLLLGIFTISLAFVVGLTCAFTSGKVILESVILTAVVVIGLTLYTFWAARRGQDFNFLGPFLFGALLVLIVFGLIQVFFPLGKISVMIYGCLASIIFCGYIVYDTDNLIKRYSYDEYIWAAVSLYLDIINLFLALLTEGTEKHRKWEGRQSCPSKIALDLVSGAGRGLTLLFFCLSVPSSPLLGITRQCYYGKSSKRNKVRSVE
ncbi:BI1-like protein [Pyrus ussuriensis x Pyrus communis]|uniref:BI1-like protein n=1 Tax=Pyrus ussuriensis x Pyrus communis TaxID=2448454 RepID=A0A5N5FVH8_9ROSA|nr:BI1-like protein [Pyrus ussuriensis x Pyrus communis]